jgi:RHS repeat-associated protein
MPRAPAHVTLAHDAAGRIATRTVAGVTETLGYLGLTETVTAIDGPGSADLAAVLDPGGTRLGLAQGSAVNWLVPDLHGSNAGALAGTTLVAATRYDGWGMTLAVGSAGGSPVAPGRFGYQGRMDLAPEAGSRLYEAGAREYAPGLGTFTALDTVIGSAADPRSMHRYLYAHGNPATLVDPDGHAAWCNTE